MRKIMLQPIQKEEHKFSINNDLGNKAKKQNLEAFQIEELLRKPRSKAYMEAMGKLDHGGDVHNEAKIAEIKQRFQEEFPLIDMDLAHLIGIVSKCYLGPEFEVHTLTIIGSIVQHYKIGEALPSNMEKARRLAKTGAYEFVEVYQDCCRCVSKSGDVSIVR